MKKTPLVIVFCFLFIRLIATNYYFSSSTGSDSNNGTIGSPYKTISKLNAIKGSLVAGDSVLFKRDDIWIGSNSGKINVINSGAVNSHIVYAAYGSGANPIISGFTTAAGWALISTGIYETTNTFGSGSTMNMVTIDNQPYAMGRYPNYSDPLKGYLLYTIVSAANKNDNDTIGSVSPILSGAPNLIGGEVVIRSIRDRLDRAIVKGVTNYHVVYKDIDAGDPVPLSTKLGYGFFFQNSPNTLDQYGEWWFNKTNHVIRMFFGNINPSSVTVKGSVIDTLMYLNHVSYIDIANLEFDGANIFDITMFSGNDVGISNCKFKYTGETAINDQNGTEHTTISNCTIDWSNNDGIFMPNTGTAFTKVLNDTVTHTGMLPGMGQCSVAGSNNYTALFVEGGNCVVQGNIVDSVGYDALFTYYCDSILVKNNIFSHFCAVKNDGGAIYTGNNLNFTPPPPRFGQRFTHNLFLDGSTSNEGVPRPVGIAGGGTQGFYLDNWSAYIQIDSNTVSNVGRTISCHNCSHMNIYGNVAFNNWEAAAHPYEDSGNIKGESDQLIRNNVIKHNIWVARDSLELIFTPQSQLRNDIGLFGTFDSNYYCRPIYEPQGILTTIKPPNAGIVDVSLPTSETWYSLDKWKTAGYGYDAHTVITAKQEPDTSKIRFEYNPTTTNKIISFLTGTNIGVDGTVYSYLSTLTLSPYTSVVLLRDSFGIVPAVSAFDTCASETHLTEKVRIGLSQITTNPVTINWKTGAGTAIPPGDYKSTNGTLTIPAGSLSGFVTVTIVADKKPENTETFNLIIVSSNGATVSKAVAVCTIMNDSTPCP